nr:hypothetical protein [Pandoravirus massiliensis]
MAISRVHVDSEAKGAVHHRDKRENEPARDESARARCRSMLWGGRSVRGASTRMPCMYQWRVPSASTMAGRGVHPRTQRSLQLSWLLSSLRSMPLLLLSYDIQASLHRHRCNRPLWYQSRRPSGHSIAGSVRPYTAGSGGEWRRPLR